MARTDPSTVSSADKVDVDAENRSTNAPAARAEGASEVQPMQRYGRLLLLAVLVAAVAALVWPRSGTNAGPGGFLVDAAGRPAPLGERLAPVTLLHFYATWCPPCIGEAPAMRRLTHDLASQPKFRVVLVAVADDVAKAQALAGTDQVLYDPQWETAHRYGTDQLPESYLLVDGKLIRKFVGPVAWDDAQVRDEIARAIASAR
jgi:cytochrome c biogenesis protein CcmG, thiol:disulfide interchange protein DsbE